MTPPAFGGCLTVGVPNRGSGTVDIRGPHTDPDRLALPLVPTGMFTRVGTSRGDSTPRRPVARAATASPSARSPGWARPGTPWAAASSCREAARRGRRLVQRRPERAWSWRRRRPGQRRPAAGGCHHGDAAHGAVERHGDARPRRRFRYTPESQFHGPDSSAYLDNGHPATACTGRRRTRRRTASRRRPRATTAFGRRGEHRHRRPAAAPLPNAATGFAVPPTGLVGDTVPL